MEAAQLLAQRSEEGPCSPESSPKQSWLGRRKGQGPSSGAEPSRKTGLCAGGRHEEKGEKSLAWDQKGRAEPTEPKGFDGAGHVGSRNEHGTQNTQRQCPCPEGPSRRGGPPSGGQAAAGRHPRLRRGPGWRLGGGGGGSQHGVKEGWARETPRATSLPWGSALDLAWGAQTAPAGTLLCYGAALRTRAGEGQSHSMADTALSCGA